MQFNTDKIFSHVFTSVFRMNFGQYVIVTFILHALFFFSIFEIFLTSPIITGLDSLPPKNQRLAKRAVVVSIDGMRHRTFVLKTDDGEFRANHILSRACQTGVYAKSITQVFLLKFVLVIFVVADRVQTRTCCFSWRIWRRCFCRYGRMEEKSGSI